ncbi:PREDICTED: pentatricopeptide repeat-containing protein At1g63080, mitochondrial-like [Tarenaya hassleriana]|uniref:pentatricopeptide repeat-containing protein At1g63080, mitochondrial-like n=1 Tax=Tarenaya hassleriana TaxID=28532 RepID=UPI00053C40B4|nr:PREDICTED: pentatricopeptide repeat-containing protein At1g63080, mitochondrial-like [Tarenaya hassleriana]
MAIRVLSSRFLIINPKSNRFLCTDATSSSSSSTTVLPPLVKRLLQIPEWKIKTTLDSDSHESLLESGESIWDTVIVSLSSSSPDKARLVLEWRLEKMLKTKERDHERYSNLISLCGRIQNVPLAMQVFSSMEAQGVRPVALVFNSLIHTCLCSNNALAAFSLFELMENSHSFKPNAETYDAFISGFAKLNNSDAAQRWFTAKKDAGFPGTLENFENLMRVCVKSRDFDGTDRFYEEMTSVGIMPNDTVLKTMFEALCEQRNFVRVKELVKNLLDLGYEINIDLAKTLVGFLSSCQNEAELEDLLVTLEERRQTDPEVLSCVHHGIITTYASLDRLDDIEYSVGRMLKRGFPFKIASDVEKVISAYFRGEAYDRLDLFLDRIKGSYCLTRSTYDLLIAGYRRARLPEKIDTMIKEMEPE